MTSAITIAANVEFQAIAMSEAFNMISKDTGISRDSLISQFADGKNK